jgi:hypothetical protein
VVNNKHLFIRNLEVHNHDNRSAKNFHLPVTNLTIYQKNAYYTGIKIFNYLSTHIKNVANEVQVFKKTLTLSILMSYIYGASSNASLWQMGFNSAFKGLKTFLLDNSFYSIDEYFNANKWYTFLIVMISWCNWYLILLIIVL